MSSYVTSTAPSEVFPIDLAAAPVTIFMPFLARACFRRLAISPSNGGRICFMNSMTVTFEPKAENTEANSMPITPPPMMVRLSGT